MTRSVIADAERLGLVISYDLELSGTKLESFAAAVSVITAAAQAMGSRPERSFESIHLRFYRHPRHFLVRTHNPEGAIARLPGEAVRS